MSTYLIDSDVLIDYFKRRKEAVELINKLGSSGELAISVLSVTELRAGWEIDLAEKHIPDLYAIFQRVVVTQEIAEIAGEYRKEYGKRGITLPTIDVLIASTAILNNYVLVTRNIKHYPLPELSLYKNPYGK